MLKVLNITSDKNIGGAGKLILTFLKEFDREKFSVSVLMPRDSLLKSEVEKLGIRVIETDYIADKSFSIKGTFAIRKILKKEKPDIVHTHASLSARIAAKMCNLKPIIYTRHSVFENKPLVTHGIGKFLNGALNNFLADKIIAVAKAAADNIIEAGVSEEKIVVVKNGVSPVLRKDKDTILKIKNEYGINEKDVVFSILARLNVVKGHEYFIKAAKLIEKEFPNAKFIIAGTGEEEEKLKAMAKDSKNIIFAGFVEDVSRILSVTDVAVNASFGTEATSLALLEAMSLNIPIIATDFGGNVELVINNENGILIKKQSIDELYLAMKKLIVEEDLRKNLGDTAKKMYETLYTAKVMTKKIEDVYIDAKGELK